MSGPATVPEIPVRTWPGLSETAVHRALLVIATTQAIVALLFVLQVPWATALWPFPGRTPLSNLFIASIFLAAAASTGWCLMARSDRGLAGIALDYLTILVPFTVYSLIITLDGGGAGVAAFAVACAVGAAVGLALLRWSLRRPWRDPRPTPRPVLVAFVVFSVALVIVSLQLILQMPRILPWFVTPQLSTLYGFMFLGAAAYFIFGLIERRWENAGGQLAGFLAYDAVLIVPLLQELLASGGGGYSDGGGGAVRLNLIVYAVVILASGALALWYLVVRRDTRPWSPIPGAARPDEGH